MTAAQVVKKSVTFNNIPTQDYCSLTGRGHHIPPTYVMINSWFVLYLYCLIEQDGSRLPDLSIQNKNTFSDLYFIVVEVVCARFL